MTDILHNVKGHCLCGAVAITVAELDPNFGACHCDYCRRWSGGPVLAADCGDEVAFEHEELISIYDSSAWAQRGFCSQCGSHLFYKLIASGQYIMPVGLFNLSDQLTLDHQIFVDHKPDYYHFAETTAMLTGAQVFAGLDDDDDHDEPAS